MSNLPPPTMPPPTMASPMVRKSSLPDASRGSRLLASIVDSACGIVLYMVLLFTDSMPIFLLGLAGLAAYQIYLLSNFGQTIGKQMMNIRIVKMDTGENGGFMTNVGMRAVVNGIIGIIPFYSLIDILFIFREDRRRIHDMIAGTKVIED